MLTERVHYQNFAIRGHPVGVLRFLYISADIIEVHCFVKMSLLKVGKKIRLSIY